METRRWPPAFASTLGDSEGLHKVTIPLHISLNLSYYSLSLCPYRISDIQLEDAGEYECVAENAVGRATGTTSLRVHAVPVVELLPNERRLRVTVGDEVRVTCLASGFPNPTVQWNIPDQYALDRSFGRNTADLNIYSVSQADAGVYTCTANNEAGSDQIFITIDVQPKRGDIGERK